MENIKKGRSHNETIIDQFSRQAVPFSQAAGHLDSIDLLIRMSGITNQDTVLDVACGPGLVACEFAKKAKHVTGIDLTSEMIRQARRRQETMDLTNMSWDIGTADSLPYPENHFSCVLTRYSFHHLEDPEVVLQEMIRVCKPGGVILIDDFLISAEKAEAFNKMEIMRDPSHVKALAAEEFARLFEKSGLHDLKREHYVLRKELEKHLEASFPNPGDTEKIKELFRNDIGVDDLGVAAHLEKEQIWFSYPLVVFAGRK